MKQIQMYEKGYGKNREFAFVNHSDPTVHIITDVHSVYPSSLEMPLDAFKKDHLWRQIPAKDFTGSHDE